MPQPHAVRDVPLGELLVGSWVPLSSSRDPTVGRDRSQSSRIGPTALRRQDVRHVHAQQTDSPADSLLDSNGRSRRHFRYPKKAHLVFRSGSTSEKKVSKKSVIQINFLI